MIGVSGQVGSTMKPLAKIVRDDMRQPSRRRIQNTVSIPLYLELRQYIWTKNITYEIAADLLLEGLFGKYKEKS